MNNIPLTAMEVRNLTNRANGKPENAEETPKSLYEIIFNRHFLNMFNAINKQASLGGDKTTFTIQFHSDVHRQVYQNLATYLVTKGFGIIVTHSHLLPEMDEATLTISW